MKKFDPTLYFITDSTDYSEGEFFGRIEAALRGGVTLMQLREKDRSTREYISLGYRVKQLADRYQVPLIIDDRLDVAMAIGCAGVHLGQSDMPVDTARKILGNDRIIGATAKTVPQAEEAWRNGADYLGCGAIYPTTTHVKTQITSTKTLDAVCRAVPIPVNAIGGLKPDNCGVLRGIGIAGICVVSAIMKADDPERAARELLRVSEDLIGGKH